MAQETEVAEEEEKEVLLPNTNIITHCIYKNDLVRFLDCFENDEDPYKDVIQDLLNERDEDGKSALDIAAILGRIDLARELLNRGFILDNTAEKGYTPWHYAAAWGQVGILKVLFDFNANFQKKNIFGERARETALRYSKAECVDYLDWAEAKVNLMELTRSVLEIVTDPSKTQGVISKEEKNLVVNACKEKNEWLDFNPEATTQEFINQHHNLTVVISQVLQKINDPPEKPEKK